MKNKTVIVSIAVAMILAMAACPVEAAFVSGTDLSNFDVPNFTGGPVDDFDLILQGTGLDCSDIVYFYPGWGTAGPAPYCIPVGAGKIRVTWTDPADPIPNATFRHMGLTIVGVPDLRVEKAFWTVAGEQVGASLVFPWQTWRGSVVCPVADDVWPPDSFPVFPSPLAPPWTIERDWAYSPVPIPLDSLTRNNSMIANLEWSSTQVDIMTGNPADSLPFWTTQLPDSGQVVFRIAVIDDDIGPDTLVYFINSVVLGRPVGRIPTLSEWGAIIFGTLLLGSVVFYVWRRRRVAVA